MTAPCPQFGFEVILELRADADAIVRGAFWSAWTAFLERDGLLAARRGGCGSTMLFVITREGTQATDADRTAFTSWLEKRTEVGRWSVEGLADQT